jgi:hypothetical protein
MVKLRDAPDFDASNLRYKARARYAGAWSSWIGVWGKSIEWFPDTIDVAAEPEDYHYGAPDTIAGLDWYDPVWSRPPCNGVWR